MIHQDWFCGELIFEHRKEIVMSNPSIEPDLRDELRNAPAEPLLPIEKKLVAWSIGIGLVLLIVLAALNHVYAAV